MPSGFSTAPGHRDGPAHWERVKTPATVVPSARIRTRRDRPGRHSARQLAPAARSGRPPLRRHDRKFGGRQWRCVRVLMLAFGPGSDRVASSAAVLRLWPSSVSPPSGASPPSFDDDRRAVHVEALDLRAPSRRSFDQRRHDLTGDLLADLRFGLFEGGSLVRLSSTLMTWKPNWVWTGSDDVLPTSMEKAASPNSGTIAPFLK